MCCLLDKQTIKHVSHSISFSQMLLCAVTQYCSVMLPADCSLEELD